MKLLLGPLPPPVTGQSLAFKELVNAAQRQHSHVECVDLKKSTFRQGLTSLNRVREVVRQIGEIRRALPRASVIYLTNVESVAGNIKDLVIYWSARRQLSSFVIHLHGGAGMRDIMAGRKGRWLAAMNRYFVSRMGGVIVLGDRLRPIYQGVVPDERLHAVVNFAPSDVFLPIEEVAAKYSAPMPINLLFLSNLLPGKGHVELIAGLRSMTPEQRNLFTVKIAGGFEDAAQEVQFLHSIQDLPNVTYQGVVAGEVKRKLLAEAHIFCLPTYYPYEGQPISILESYASGCCVVTTDHSGIFDIFADGANGRAVEKRSAMSVAAALLALAADTTAMTEIALRNAAYARQRFTVEDHTRQLLAILDSVSRTNNDNGSR